ncbi:I78 family peptidase inhibitor [Loktanella sp. DJP18]|uniref:I78 family peptidase inhibitor n=1 Tax=Loktanella sp. DJP18 TaxID=3409788 RepID=UPI003BB7953C
MSRFSLIPLLFPLLAACTPPVPVTAPPDPGSDACGASGYQSLVGRPLAAATFPADLDMRIINPGEAVTMDYRADRLNVELDSAGIIQVVRCG